MNLRFFGLGVCVIALAGCLTNQAKTDLCATYIASFEKERVEWLPVEASPPHLEVSPESDLEKVFGSDFDSEDYSFVWFESSRGNTAACGVHLFSRCASVFFEYSDTGELVEERMSTCE